MESLCRPPQQDVALRRPIERTDVARHVRARQRRPGAAEVARNLPQRRPLPIGNGAAVGRPDRPIATVEGQLPPLRLRHFEDPDVRVAALDAVNGNSRLVVIEPGVENRCRRSRKRLESSRSVGQRQGRLVIPDAPDVGEHTVVRDRVLGNANVGSEGAPDFGHDRYRSPTHLQCLQIERYREQRVAQDIHKMPR